MIKVYSTIRIAREVYNDLSKTGNDECEGLGNTAETFTGQKNPDKLGELLDCVDQDDEDDPEVC